MEKKIECEIVQDLLLNYSDDIINEASKKLIEKHLQQCKSCQKQLDDIKTYTEKTEQSQEKSIDYLKKIRRNSRIKSIFIAIGIILLLLFTVYVYKFIQINLIAIRGAKSLEANNFYKETIQVISDNKAIITKDYFKDGKYKSVSETYVNGEIKSLIAKYSSINSDEILLVDVSNKRVSIEKNETVKLKNQEKDLKYVPFVLGLQESVITRMGVALTMSIFTDIDEIGKEYYVLKMNLKKTQNGNYGLIKKLVYL